MCSVAECDSWRRSAQRFKLPDDPERRLEWVQFLFEVNNQRLRESSWTEITICSEHFTESCLVQLYPSGTFRLRPGAVPSVRIKSESEPAVPSVLKSESESEPAVPSVRIKSEAEDPELYQEVVETTEVSSHFCKLEPCDSPSACSDESEVTSMAIPMPSDTSHDFMSDFGPILQKVVNIDLIREKASRLNMKGKYVVNEKRLLQLFRLKCPLCCSKVKVEKFTYGLLIILNQQCLQCEYRYQWKSQINASVPAAEDQHPTGGIDVTPEIQQTLSTNDNSTVTGVSEMVACTDDESDPTDEDETDSDEDWTPVNELVQDHDLFNTDSDEDSEDYDNDPLVSQHSELCTDCGKFFNKLKPHTCEHIIKPFSCNICGKRCATEVALNSHSRVHDENYEHRCKYCHVAFKTRTDKINHEPSHIAEEKPYKCPNCSESFATNKKRRIHQLDHRGSQTRCNICGVDFYQSNKLQRHLAVHTGEKPFKCSVCQRGFNQASHLKSHMRLHTGEKPYKCQQCDKSFNHNVSLKSHVQRYHTTNSGCEQERKTNSGTVGAQKNRNKKGTESGRDNGKEARKKKDALKHKRKSTGRPVGRPKRNAAGNLVQAEEMQSQCSNTKTAKAKVQTSKTTVCSDEEREDELMESDVSFHSAEEEEERSKKIPSRTSGLRRTAKKSDSDSDFSPEDSKKRRYSCRNRDVGSRQSLGRPERNQDT